MTLAANADAAEFSWLDDIVEPVALAGQRVPQLKAAVSLALLAHHEDHFAIGHAMSTDDVGLVLLALLLVDVEEVVSEDDGVLLVVATTQVEELLRRRPQIGKVLEHAQVFNVWDH